ncbi:MAG: flap endonuclease-1 [Thaumarchaeota archaeon]|nr:MAG: flap endonuclease-1 [Nitrososphaerota archaeon]TLX91223.1 MAG: flap endonuclease-1 [Nitrososphaerota archaeon]
MGLDLKPILTYTNIKISNLSNKIIAVDAFNTIHQFLATIRGSTGELLTNSNGEITSHLSGLFYRNINLLAEDIKLVYVFDGVSSALKTNEIHRRHQIKELATEKYEKALLQGKLDEARKYSQGTSVLTDKMIEESKRLLSLLGIPTIQAPSEGEATAARLTNSNLVDICASQDYDSILFGAKRLVRNITISGKRKAPNRNAYIEVPLEIFYLEDILHQTKLTTEQLVDVGILIGTDYNFGGIPGIGPKTALKLIQKYSKLENIEQLQEALSNIPYEEIRELFLKPDVTNVTNDDIKFNSINYDKIVEFLCNEKNFSTDRVNSALLKVQNSNMNKNQSLEKWF